MGQNISSGFVSPREMLEWADEAIQELDIICRDFFANNPCASVIDVDEDARQEVHKVKLMRELPKSVARKATEALNNIRLSFDQAYLAGLKVAGVPAKVKTLHFPWADSPDDLEKNRFGPVPERLRPVFRDIAPYPRGNGYAGGNDSVRALAQISGRNKHIARVAVRGHIVGYTHPGFTYVGKPGDAAIEFLNPTWDSVNNEVTLARCPIGSDIKHNYTIAFQVVFDETSPPFKEQVIGSLKMFMNTAKAFVDNFERACT